MKEQKIILGNKIITPCKIIKKGIIVINDGVIEYVGEEKERRLTSYSNFYRGEYVVPGFIDIHCHGGNGYDTMDSTQEALKEISKFKAKNGCTGFLATTVTSSIKDTAKVLKNVNEYSKQFPKKGAEMLGVHLEGPFINIKQKGAQREDLIMPPSIEIVKYFIRESGRLIKIITYAPELDTGFEFTSFLHKQGIITSVGHSNATYAQVQAGIQAGLSHVTHTFNAMREIHHREPGVVGAALSSPELTVEIVADGIHVHPVVIKILIQARENEKIVLITDAMRAAGMPEGVYELGGQEVTVAKGQARLKDETLAGSVLTMDKAVKNMVNKIGIQLPKAIQMASFNPARSIGIDDKKGSLEPGKDADIVILNKNLETELTIVAGKIVYRRK